MKLNSPLFTSLYLSFTASLMALPVSAASPDDKPVRESGLLLPYHVLRDDLADGAHPGHQIIIRNGGFGSDAAAHPTLPNHFYGLTDRGPNAAYQGQAGKGKMFPVPDYTPRIGLFELGKDGQVRLIQEILLKRPDGTPITGLPNTSAYGGTGETPYDVQGKVIRQHPEQPFDTALNPARLDDFGLDGEGLVAMKDGSFWVSDEYGPHIVHYNDRGIEIDRINPFAKDPRTRFTLPAELANRRANRGMEGLTVTPDETTLVGIMQSTMHNPDKRVQDLNLVRLITVNLTTGDVGQYLYRQEKNQNSNSGIVALSDQEFLVIERDGQFIADAPDAMKRIYRIDLRGATNLESLPSQGHLRQDSSLGLMLDDLTVEQLVKQQGWQGLAPYHIQPVSKSLVVDLIATLGYPHDKLEGMWLIDNQTLGVLNDDDFATWSSKGILEQKFLDAGKTIEDAGKLYVLDHLNLEPQN